MLKPRKLPLSCLEILAFQYLLNMSVIGFQHLLTRICPDPIHEGHLQQRNIKLNTAYLPVSVFLQHGSYTMSYGFLCGTQMRIDIHSEFFLQKLNAEIRIGYFLTIQLDPRYFSFLGKVKTIIIYIRNLCHTKKRFQLETRWRTIDR